MANAQTIRFRRPTNQPKEAAVEPPKRIDRHAGILQDQLRRWGEMLHINSYRMAELPQISESALVPKLLSGGANLPSCKVCRGYVL